MLNSLKLQNMLHQSNISHILHPNTNDPIQRLDGPRKQLKKPKKIIADSSHLQKYKETLDESFYHGCRKSSSLL